jgi:hypothetical protein
LGLLPLLFLNHYLYLIISNVHLLLILLLREMNLITQCICLVYVILKGLALERKQILSFIITWDGICEAVTRMQAALGLPGDGGHECYPFLRLVI